MKLKKFILNNFKTYQTNVIWKSHLLVAVAFDRDKKKRHFSLTYVLIKRLKTFWTFKNYCIIFSCKKVNIFIFSLKCSKSYLEFCYFSCCLKILFSYRKLYIENTFKWWCICSYILFFICCVSWCCYFS